MDRLSLRWYVVNLGAVGMVTSVTGFIPLPGDISGGTCVGIRRIYPGVKLSLEVVTEIGYKYPSSGPLE